MRNSIFHDDVSNDVEVDMNDDDDDYGYDDGLLEYQITNLDFATVE